MNKINDLPKEVPNVNHTFQIDLIGETTSQRFLGEFTSRIPTLKDQGLIAKHEAMLNGEQAAYLNPGVLKLHKMIAYLRFTLVDAPTRWKQADLGYELRDMNVIEGVYNEVLAYEGKWLKLIWGDQEEEKDESKKD